MFRRRTSSPGKIHYRININKNMCLSFVDIYIDGKPYQSGFNGSYLDVYRDKKIKTISISGQISYLNPNFTYRTELQTQVLDESYVAWDGDYVLNDNCIVTDLCSGCESYAYGEKFSW